MIAFIHIEKTAGSTFKNVLRRSFGLHHCDAVAAQDGIFRDRDLQLANIVYFGLRSLCSHHFKDSVHTLSAPIDFVTFVRDPVQRTASHYQQLVKRVEKGRIHGLLEFEEWLQSKALNYQIRKLSGGDDVDAAIRLIEEHFMFVGLTDQYEQSLRAFAALSPWPVNTRIEKRNVTANVSTKNRLLDAPKSRALIEEATQADRQLYTYLKDEFFPAQQQRADAARARHGSRDHTGDHYLASRLYSNLVYRRAVKISRMLKR